MASLQWDEVRAQRRYGIGIRLALCVREKSPLGISLYTGIIRTVFLYFSSRIAVKTVFKICPHKQKKKRDVASSFVFLFSQ